MRIIISPAKKMNADTDSLPWHDLPVFLKKTEQLYNLLREMSYEELKKLWKCNDSITELNQKRLASMDLHRKLTPAVLAYEGAIGIVGGKAKLLREDSCDGLGDCLPACPMSAISFEEREASAYNEAAVLAAKKEKSSVNTLRVESQLNNFPVQIQLAPINAPYFEGADLLIAADCTAFSYGNFHNDFMRNRITLIGCPKLDGVNYAEKLADIFRHNDIRSITVTRMTVPCCGGLPFAVKNALAASGKDIPLHIVTIKPDGEILR